MAAPARRDTTLWSPLTEIERMREEFDRLLGAGTGDVLREGGFVPSADLEETDDDYVVDIELPGIKREDIDVELSGRRLTVTGERKEKERKGLVRRSTRTVGRFRYEVVLPSDVSDEGCDASFNDGVLTIRVPKGERERARHIDIS